MRFASFLTFFLHFSFFCFAAPPHAAMELRGRVVDAERNPMVGAQVQLFEVGKKLPFDFRSTNGRGEFMFRIKQPRVVRLEIRAMGREDFTQELNLLTVANGDLDLGDILLQPHFEEINEVHVEAQKPVVRRSDTVAFRVGAFALGGEKSIEEVIKNMPGMKVEGDGKIRYQGREVERVMVGGADMFGRNYQLLTKNLDPTAVNEVQVLEHFEENRLMRRHRSSERVVTLSVLYHLFSRGLRGAAHHAAHETLILVGHRHAIGPAHHGCSPYASPLPHVDAIACQRNQGSRGGRLIVNERPHRDGAIEQRGAH